MATFRKMLLVALAIIGMFALGACIKIDGKEYSPPVLDFGSGRPISAPAGVVPTTAPPPAPAATVTATTPVATTTSVPAKPTSGPTGSPVAVTPASGQTPIGAAPFQPPAVLPEIKEGKVISTDPNFWGRVVLRNDGNVYQDVIRSEEMGSRPSFEVEFTLPNPIPGGNDRVIRGIRGTLVKLPENRPVANGVNGQLVTLVPGSTYRWVAPAGNNNSFSLEFDVPIDKVPTNDRPYIISAAEDDTRVVIQPDGRVYMDKVFEGHKAFKTTFILPPTMSEKRRVYQGNNAVLSKAVNASGKVDWQVVDGKLPNGQAAKTSRAQNVLIEVEPGATYMIEGGDFNGGFALEMPKG